MFEPIPAGWLVLFYIVIVVFIAAATLGISYVLGERHRDWKTAIPYESGNLPAGSAQIRFFIRFYLVAMIFVVFDVESVFIVAWAVSVRESAWQGLIEMVVFIGIFLIALLYLVRQGALNFGSTEMYQSSRHLSAKVNSVESIMKETVRKTKH